MILRFLVSTFLVVAIATPANAFVSLEGYFIAFEECEAFQSKNRMTNPGPMTTEVMRAYEILGINKAGGDFYQVKMDGAPVTEARWVHVSCGLHVEDAQTQTAELPGDGGVEPSPGTESTDNLLALSWQPAFCETRPNKPECEALNDGELPHTEAQLSIHGLWPQPNGNLYCGVPQALEALDSGGNWSELPAPEIDDDTRDRLVALMPGTMSALDRHEWIKHGTCYRGEGGADEYFDDTLFLVERLNASPIVELLANHVGAEVETVAIRDLFDREFGPGAGLRVQFHCTGDQGRVLLQELKINLVGEINPDADVSELLLAAEETTLGCPRGVIDPVGLQ